MSGGPGPVARLEIELVLKALIAKVESMRNTGKPMPMIHNLLCTAGNRSRYRSRLCRKPPVRGQHCKGPHQGRRWIDL